MWTKKDLADYLKVSIRQVDVLREKHGLPWIMVGGMVRFRKEDVDEWLLRRQEETCQA